MLKKCSTKWDCLVYEMLYIRTIRPNLNTQSDPLGPNSLFNFQFFLIYSSLHYIYSISYISLSLDNDVLETSKRRAMFYNILSQIFIVKCSIHETNIFHGAVGRFSNRPQKNTV